VSVGTGLAVVLAPVGEVAVDVAVGVLVLEAVDVGVAVGIDLLVD
jgi:hypothetical protein